jgi:hypothetical protein
MEGLTKPRRYFMISTMVLFLSLRGRCTFKGLERYGDYCEKSYRLWFEKPFDFLAFNSELCHEHLSDHRINVFDPSYLPKSGKHTPNTGTFYSGCLGKAVRGMEIGGLGVVDVANNTAFSLEAVPTPSPKALAAQGKSLVDHYAEVIILRFNKLEQMSKYLAVDGYFAKQAFVDPVLEQTDLELICKLRKDANLRYLYKGPKKKGRGRPKKYDGKVNLKKIDKRRFKTVHQDQEVILYQAVVWSVFLKRKINLVYAEFLDGGKPTNRYALYFSTDLALDGLTVYRYYKARFQIEFLFRDAKQHTGLTHCQARSENKLHFHFNTALTAVGVAKAAHHVKDKKASEKPFSLADVKTSYFNELMLNLFFSNFHIQPELIENKSKLDKLLNFGKIAA